MVKKFLTVLVLGLAVFAVSCGGKDVSDDELDSLASAVTAKLYQDTMPTTAKDANELVGDAFNAVITANEIVVGTDGKIATYVEKLTAVSSEYADVSVDVTDDDLKAAGNDAIKTFTATITLTAKEVDSKVSKLARDTIEVTFVLDERTLIDLTGSSTDLTPSTAGTSPNTLTYDGDGEIEFGAVVIKSGTSFDATFAGSHEATGGEIADAFKGTVEALNDNMTVTVDSVTDSSGASIAATTYVYDSGNGIVAATVVLKLVVKNGTGADTATYKFADGSEEVLLSIPVTLEDAKV